MGDDIRQARTFGWAATVITVAIVGILLPSKLYLCGGVLLAVLVIKLAARRA